MTACWEYSRNIKLVFYQSQFDVSYFDFLEILSAELPILILSFSTIHYALLWIVPVYPCLFSLLLKTKIVSKYNSITINHCISEVPTWTSCHVYIQETFIKIKMSNISHPDSKVFLALDSLSLFPTPCSGHH